MATKIYIDQGHNPQNPNAGAEGNGLREQNIVYRIGIELAALLRAQEFLQRNRANETADMGGENAVRGAFHLIVFSGFYRPSLREVDQRPIRAYQARPEKQT